MKKRGKCQRIKPAAPQTTRRVHANEPSCNLKLYSSETCLLLATTVALWIPVLRMKERRAVHTRITRTRTLVWVRPIEWLMVYRLYVNSTLITAASYYSSEQLRILLKSAGKAGGYRINLRGHPSVSREEVLLSYHRSSKQRSIRIEELPH